MENDPIKKKASIKPRLLGQIPIDPAVTRPMGGINPYSSSFDKIGQEFYAILQRYCEYKPSFKIADIGCGTGRLAKQISGNYTGIEINRRFYQYCVAKYRNHSFKYLDYYHEEYNHKGQVTTYKLPLEDSSQNIVTSIAVLNHNNNADVDNIIREASRILVHKGLLLVTAFLSNNPLNDRTDRPLLNSATSEQLLRKSLLANGMMIREPILYGSWRETEIGLSYHDIVIASKGT